MVEQLGNNHTSKYKTRLQTYKKPNIGVNKDKICPIKRNIDKTYYEI